MDSEILQSLASIASFLAGFFTAVFAEPFRQWLSRPRLHLTFRPEFGEGTGYVSRTPEKDGTEEISYYVRASAKNSSRNVAKNCRAFLLTIEYESSPKQFKLIHHDLIPLDWAFVGPTSMDIPPNVSFHFDVFSISSYYNKIQPRTTPPAAIWPTSLLPKGKYRFTVCVAGDNVKPTHVSLVFKWLGSFEKFSPDCFEANGS